MKKAIVLVSFLAANTFLIADDCKKMDINELRYMDKSELESKYKREYYLYNSFKLYLEGYLYKQAVCYLDNATNIGRVLKKDFSYTDADLEKLK